MYEGPERRAIAWLTEEQLEAIAERAAEKALEKVYAQVGKSVISKVLWVVGSGAIAAYAYFKGLKGW